ELYQRLPRRPNDDNPTIVKAKYPLEVSEYHNPHAEEQFDLVFSVVKAARSLIVEYNIRSNASLFIQVASDSLATLFTAQEQSIVTLVKGAKSVHVVQHDESIPAGCALSTVTDEINLLLLVKGFVDIDAEVAKFQSKLDKTTQALALLQKKIQIPDYESKVPRDVRDANEAKQYLGTDLHKF
ncbi:17097_t:CDS:2, partial [Racocetra fulgida]